MPAGPPAAAAAGAPPPPPRRRASPPQVTKDGADELLESQKDRIQEEIKGVEGELATIRETLAGLKKQLYGRFGGNINLEE